MSGVRKKLISGVFWESVGQFASLGIQFIVTIVIARILTPADYGTIGLLTVFVALSLILLDSGFSVALIQKKNADESDFSSIFFFNLAAGIILYAILFRISPYIAEFYNIPELTRYARILFLVIPINSLGLIQNVILQKQLLFKKSAVASVTASVMSGIVGIGMAYSGLGIISLVAQQLSMYFFRTLFYIIQIRWWPKAKLSFRPIREMLTFSVNLTIHSLISTTMKNIYTLVIGKHYSSEEVGYYNQAHRFESISATTITGVIMKVSFPALVHFKDDKIKAKDAYRKILSMTCFIICPLMVLLINIAEPLFRLLLTEKWLPAVPYFKLLCLYGLTFPVIQISYNIYKLYRKGRLLVAVDSARHILMIVAIVFTLKHGVSAMLMGQFVVMLIMAFVNMYFSGREISYAVTEQIQTIMPYYALASLCGIMIWIIPPFVQGDLMNIVTNSLIFIVVFLAFAAILRLNSYKESVSILKHLLNKKHGD